MADDPVPDGAAFYLAPSLVQAMQRVPATFPEVAATSDATRELSILHDQVADYNDHISGRSTQNQQLDRNSSSKISRSQDSRHSPPENSNPGGRFSGKARPYPDQLIRSLRAELATMNLERMHLKSRLSENNRELGALKSEATAFDHEWIAVKQELVRKHREIEATQSSNTELRSSFHDLEKELAEAQAKLKKNAIYIESLDEYVDELETKIGFLTTPSTESQAEQAQAGTQAKPTTTSNPVQQTNIQQNVPVGDAVYRWQAHMIKRLEKEVERLTQRYEFLKENEEKYFKEAMHFERKHNDNVRNMREHMYLCHEAKSFLNKDMEENLPKIRAICEE